MTNKEMVVLSLPLEKWKRLNQYSLICDTPTFILFYFISMCLNVLKNPLYGLARAINKLTIELFQVGINMKRREEEVKKASRLASITGLFSHVHVELCVHTELEILQVHVVQYLKCMLCASIY